jgi:hypothetical protein
LIEKNSAAANSLLSKLAKTFSLASLLKSLGGTSDLSSLFMLGNVIAPSATWAKRIAKRDAAKGASNGNLRVANSKFINQTITNVNKNNLIARQNLHNKNLANKLNQDNSNHAIDYNQKSAVKLFAAKNSSSQSESSKINSQSSSASSGRNSQKKS